MTTPAEDRIRDVDVAPRSSAPERSPPRTPVDAHVLPLAVGQANASEHGELDQPPNVCVFASQLLSVEVLRRPLDSAQYVSLAFTRRLEEARISGSMGGVGSAYDNAAAESLFATIKRELVNRHRFPTRAAARAAVFEFAEVFHNRRRLHSSLGNLSPAEWEKRFQQESREASVA